MNLKNNPELIPLVEWWEKDGKSTLVYLLVAAIAVGGWYGWKAHRAAVRMASAEAVATAYTTEELKEAVAKFSSQPVAGALKLKLAKSYYDAGEYQQALDMYSELRDSAPDGFADVPVVGSAQCLEAMGKFAEAQKAFADFAAANTNSYLKLTADLGSVRCLCEAGDKAKALAALETLKAANKDDELATARIEATEKLVKRFATPAAK